LNKNVTPNNRLYLNLFNTLITYEMVGGYRTLIYPS